MKVSFDFDSTLTTAPVQALCKKFLDLGAEVFVTTSRATMMYGNKPINNDDVFQLTDMLGIDRENIQFTEHDDKYKFVKDFDLHFDDDVEEIFLINQYQGKCIGLLYEEKFNNGLKDW